MSRRIGVALGWVLAACSAPAVEAPREPLAVRAKAVVTATAAASSEPSIDPWAQLMAHGGPAAPKAPAAKPPVAPSTPTPAAGPEPIPEPITCGPLPVYPPIGFLHRRDEPAAGGVEALVAGPRFTTREKVLAPSLVEVQKTLDAFTREVTQGGEACTKDCGGVEVSCQVTRNDGEFLSVLCAVSYWHPQARPGQWKKSFLWRRVGDTMQRLDLQQLARDPKGSLALRVIADVNETRPLPTGMGEVDHGVPESSYVVLRDDSFEAGTAVPHDPTPRGFTPLSALGPHLLCDQLLDMPKMGEASAPKGALVFATHIEEEDDPSVAGFWGARVSSATTVTLRAHHPSHVAVAKLINERLDRYIAKQRARVASEQWRDLSLQCEALTSTADLVSVLCHNSGWSDKLNTQRAGGTSVTMLLGESKEITVADVLAAKPNAPSQIARRCLGHLVRKSEGDWDPTLDAVPALTVNDLKHFGLWSRGVLFALPFELGGRQMVSACYVPYRELKTSLSSVVALAKKR